MESGAKVGLEKVPVRYLDLNEEEAHLLAIADNKLAESSDWDLPILLDVLKPFSDEDLIIAGWSRDELANLEATFSPADESEQGNLGTINKVKCPKCGHEF